MRYTLNVGNIGTVLETDDLKVISAEFKQYVELSKKGVGRAGNEDVFIMDDKYNDIIKEYIKED